MFKNFRVLILVMAAFLVSGCASDKMLILSEPPAAIQTPSADQSTIVVFRSSYFGGAVQSSVFDVTDGNPELIGIVSAGTKVAYIMPPGKRRLMAVGENASFLDVTGSPGKTYFARVTPRMGLWKARFLLRPVPASDTGLVEELAGCKWAENTEASKAWAYNGKHNLIAKMNKYLPKWELKTNKATLHPADGK